MPNGNPYLPRRGSASKPRVGVRHERLPWVSFCLSVNPKWGCASIPNIPFVPRGLMFAQERAQFILETYCLMVLLQVDINHR